MAREGGMVSIRYKQRYYCVSSETGYRLSFGKGLVEELQAHPVDYWKQLMDQAMVVVVRWDDKVEAPSPPSDDFLERLYRHYTSSRELKEQWSRLYDAKFRDWRINGKNKTFLNQAMSEMRDDPTKAPKKAKEQLAKMLVATRKRMREEMGWMEDEDPAVYGMLASKENRDYAACLWKRIKMGCVLDDVRRFKMLCRQEGWGFICKAAASNPKTYLDLLKLGVLTCTMSRRRKLVRQRNVSHEYLVNLDKATFYCNFDLYLPYEDMLEYKLGSVPASWVQCSVLPKQAVMLGYAYTPEVDEMIVRVMAENLVWALVVDRMSHPYNFEWFRTLVKLIREFIFTDYVGEDRPCFRQFVESRNFDLAEDALWGPLPLLMAVHNVPSAIAAPTKGGSD